MPSAPKSFKPGARSRRSIGTTDSRRLKGRTLQNERRRVFARDRYTCQICDLITLPAQLELDHRIPLASGGTHADSNLQTACKPCHELKTADEQPGHSFQ